MAPRWLSWLTGQQGDADGYQPIGDPDEYEYLSPSASRPEDSAGTLSRLFFAFATPLIRTGTQKTLDPEDLWDLSKRDASHGVYRHFHGYLEKTKTEASPNGRLGKALARAYIRPFITAGLLKLIHDSVMFTGPIILQNLLQSLDQGTGNWRLTLGLALAMLCTSTLQTFCVNQYFHILFRLGLHIKIGTIHLVYAKLLRLSNAARSEMGSGTITNLQSNDTAKLWQIPQYLHMLWSGPFQITVVMFLLIRVMHLWPALAGLGVTIAIIPLTTLLGRAIGKVRKQLLIRTDARVRLCTEIITGIKAIKLYAWEEPYEKRTSELRDQELQQIRLSALLNGLNMMVFTAGPILVSMASFCVYSMMGYKLTADVAFPSLALFNLLRFPIIMFPVQIMNMINGAVSLKRLQSFMERDEMECLPPATAAPKGQPAITVSSATFSWTRDSETVPTLKDIDLKIASGELVMVVGEVGSGKSSLLQALLGEMVQVQGGLQVLGSLAYTSQDAWIQNATLRDNILLGHPFDAAHYEATLNACALKSDLDQLQAGDQTEIGEKGINLSGGQRARVALARAVYARADVYLLDDPLSAVDAHVGAHLFQECVDGALEGTTRVLVTHQLQFLPMAHRVVVMKEGRISSVGTYEQLQQAGIDFQQLAIETQKPEEGQDKPAAAAVAGGSVATVAAPASVGSPLPTSVAAAEDDEADNRTAEPANGSAASPAEGSSEAKPLIKPDDARGRLVSAEHRARGEVNKSVYLDYLMAWGPFLLLPIAFVLFAHCERVLQVLQNYWLSIWSTATAAASSSDMNSQYMVVYFGLGAVSLVFALLRVLTIVYGTNNAARTLHMRLFHTIIALPMSFFDTQPTGRLLNRFTKDTEAVDISLSSSVTSFVICFVNVWLSLAVVITITPVFFLGVIPLGFIYWRLQKLFIATSRELKRLDSVAFSPIFSHFNETLNGLTTVRAFNKQSLFDDKNQLLLDSSNKCWWPIQVVNRWLSVRLELMGIAISFGTAICVAVLLPTNSGLAGLALTSALNLTGLMTWMVRQSTELEVNMNSVERLVEYDIVAPEAPPVVEGNRPPTNWPSQGAIKANGLLVKYRADLPPVLKGLTFNIRPAEKIGIAGRTGCGKSTLMMALYRIVEPCGGTLEIDGVDVLSIGLRDLRSRLALVPQDPVIFSGTVRSNLDPFDNHSDSQLWDALSKVSMDEVVQKMSGSLHAPIEEGGANLSVGQRQLLGMARALIRSARILVLDEATSNVDTSTDLLIQNTLREAFGSCTVLTIAHRLHTIMHSDRIMVLDSGNISELDAPANLLENPESMFTKLVEEATRQQKGMKVSKSQAAIAELIKTEAELVKRQSMERKRSSEIQR